MFIRKNRNRSGSVSVQIIFKQNGKYRVLKTVGTARDPDEIARLAQEAEHEIRAPQQQEKLFAVKGRDELTIEHFLDRLSNAQIRTVGPELIFGALFDRIGFHEIPAELFRHLVVARLAFPTSKLKTVDYLHRYRGIHVSDDTIYRFLDTLNSEHKAAVERIAHKYTTRTLGGTVSVVFYDMTTLYFETEDEDDLRKVGFSKDGKFHHPQIMLGLVVGPGGLPLGYDIFEGNTFEGHTLLPTLDAIREKYGFGAPVVVADAALLSKHNLTNLEAARYRFIIGARIKNEPEEVKEEIRSRAHALQDGDRIVITKQNGTRLIVTYTDARARKDAYNREKGLRKLRARVASGTLSKQHINNRGYNKFLSIAGDVTVSVDEEKVEADKRWDGLKGYVTNTNLDARTVVEHYGNLWQIEKAFRISKTDLRIRPVHHYRRRRIEAHICIAFAAYTVWKELERLLNEQQVEMSAKRAAELTHTMYALEYVPLGEAHTQTKVLKMDAKQRELYDAVHKRSN